jgi:hypothetical protein
MLDCDRGLAHAFAAQVDRTDLATVCRYLRSRFSEIDCIAVVSGEFELHEIAALAASERLEDQRLLLQLVQAGHVAFHVSGEDPKALGRNARAIVSAKQTCRAIYLPPWYLVQMEEAD